MINIICVLKTGGDYDKRYVFNLLNACKRNINEDFAFKCFTDDEAFLKDPDEGALLNHTFSKHRILFSLIRLEKKYSGWWSKLEIFRNKGLNLYFDLDTVILFDLSEIINIVKGLGEYDFLGMKKFNPARWENEGMFTSGIMGWNGDFRFMFDDFSYHDALNNPLVHGDADIIFKMLRHRNIQVRYIQDNFKGLYSYKWHCRSKLPEDAKVICFHGKPRPHQVEYLSFIKENWNV